MKGSVAHEESVLTGTDVLNDLGMNEIMFMDNPKETEDANTVVPGEGELGDYLKKN